MTALNLTEKISIKDVDICLTEKDSISFDVLGKMYYFNLPGIRLLAAHYKTVLESGHVKDYGTPGHVFQIPLDSYYTPADLIEEDYVKFVLANRDKWKELPE